MNPAQRELLILRIKKSHTMAKAHCQESVRSERKNNQLGIPVVILTAMVGTSVFATLQNQPHISVQIIIGLISLLATVLASLQTFLRYAEKSTEHREAALKFERLQNELEQLLAYPIEDDRSLDEKLTNLREEYHELAATFPNVPEHIWNAAVESVEQKMMVCADV